MVRAAQEYVGNQVDVIDHRHVPALRQRDVLGLRQGIVVAKRLSETSFKQLGGDDVLVRGHTFPALRKLGTRHGDNASMARIELV